jgi:hypothetical protein
MLNIRIRTADEYEAHIEARLRTLGMGPRLRGDDVPWARAYCCPAPPLFFLLGLLT